MVIEGTLANFKQEASDGIVLVVCSTPHCGPCRLMAPIYPLLQNVKVIKVNVEQELEIGEALSVSVVPTMFLINNGVIHEKLIGRMSQGVLQDKVNKLVLIANEGSTV